MKINLCLSASDCGDGSFSVFLHNTKEEALENLNRTEEQLENGCFYDDGMIQNISLDIDENGKLLVPFGINIDS